MMKLIYISLLTILSSCSNIGFGAGSQTFGWKAVYTPTAKAAFLDENKDEGIFNTSSLCDIDNEWALWGHNLTKTLMGYEGGSQAIAASGAEINGTRTDEQLCFSSPQLYYVLERFILDTYGEKAHAEARYPVQITIMPNDNPLVCQCAQCRKAGNTRTSATPAVTAFICKLAKRFPNHRFFTSAYLSTKEPPHTHLPENVGVFCSAIDLPMTIDFKERRQFKAFDDMLRAWHSVCDNVYVWDYIRNFDDYLSPYPMLRIMQQRLKYYSSCGVSGIFLNGSGETYAAFDDMQTSVLTQLLDNPDTDVEKAVRTYFGQNYPETCEELSAYYMLLEDEAVFRRKILPFYGGIRDSEHAFLDAKLFNDFWSELDRHSKDINGPERKKLNNLLVALNFTRMELIRSRRGLDKTAAAEALAVMKDAIDNPLLACYREANGDIRDYIKAWETEAQKVETVNALFESKVQSSFLTDEYDAAMLTDGRLGLSTDYHTNWYVTNAAEWTVTITPAEQTPKSGTVKLSFLIAPRWHLNLPSSITIMQGETTIGTFTSEEPEVVDPQLFAHRQVLIGVKDIKPSMPITVIMKRGSSNIACDEIWM